MVVSLVAPQVPALAAHKSRSWQAGLVSLVEDGDRIRHSITIVRSNWSMMKPSPNAAKICYAEKTPLIRQVGLPMATSADTESIAFTRIIRSAGVFMVLHPLSPGEARAGWFCYW